MAEPLAARMAALIGQPVTALTALQGGDLSQVFRATLSDGSHVVAKTGPRVAAEAAMLHAITEAGCAAPAVLAAQCDLLVMAHVPEATASDTGWAALGQALRRLHGSTGARYGWRQDYAFGPAPIPNTDRADWPGFWAEQRLLAFASALPTDIAHRIEALCQQLPQILPATPPAALLHGDLWRGNVIFTETGGACVIDPACYYGDAEVDLAMLHLFGTPPPAFQGSYGALPPGWRERRPAYTLWPALVHLRLFGASYRGLVEDSLSALKA